jgi:alcohol dehydrogenase (cytochrome c)
MQHWRKTALLAAAIADIVYAGLGRAATPEERATPFYTAEQARAGAVSYAANCADCHGAGLGGGAGPSLSGEGFLAKWGHRTLADLYGFEHAEMPLSAPASLTKQQYADITAYILRVNGFPAGERKLEAGADFSRLLEMSKENRNLQTRLTLGAIVAPAGASGTLAPATSPAVKQPSTSGPENAEILGADDSTGNWLFFNKGLSGARFSWLTSISLDNAANLKAVCVYQTSEVGSFQTGPVVYDGIGYVTTTHGTYAFDAQTCKEVWSYTYVPTGQEVTNNSKGAAIAGGRLIRGTQDGHLFALDRKTGLLLWDRQVADPSAGEFITAAPIVWNNAIYVGKAGGDWGIVGEMMSFDAGTGTKIWGRKLVPDPGAKTWDKPESAMTGGGSTWTSYALDPDTSTLFVPVGNPGPDFNNAVRPGANLYTNSVLALDARTGDYRWHYQLVPNDFHDWDTSVVSLFKSPSGTPLVAAAGKDGVLHVLDRTTGQLVFKEDLTTRSNVDTPFSAEGTRFCPGTLGGVEWNGPAYSPITGNLYVNAIDWCVTAIAGPTPTYIKGEQYTGLKNGFGTYDPVAKASGWTNAIEVGTGAPAWRYHSPTPMTAGVTPTAANVLFTGDLNGNFLVLDARKGDVLYRFNTGGAIGGGVITYDIDGRQYVAVASGNASRTVWHSRGASSVFIFGL